MDDWVKLTPDSEVSPTGSEMMYRNGMPGLSRPHVFKYVTGPDDYEMWNLSAAELAAIPWVAALVDAATAFRSHTDACMREVQTHFGAHCGGYDAKGEALDAALAALDPGDA